MQGFGKGFPMQSNGKLARTVALLIGDRPLPHSPSAEVAVLGSVLIAADDALPVVARMLSVEGSFYDPRHQVIIEACLDLYNKQPRARVDLVALADHLSRHGKLEAAGGHAYLAQIANSVPTAANIEHYVSIVRDHAVLRRLIRAGADMVENCFEPHDTIKELTDSIEEEILSVTADRQSGEAVALSDVVMDAFDYINKLRTHDPSVMGIQTGFNQLDRITMGLRAGEMIVLAARPSMGKTSLALNIAENLAVKTSTPLPVGIFSLEMNVRQLVLRLLCSQALISLSDIREGAMSGSRWQAIGAAAQRLKTAPIYIDDATANMDVLELRARARRMKRDYDIRVLFVDYLQLLKPVLMNRNATRENEVSQMSSGIKGLAKELNIPIVVLAQLNRQADDAAKGGPRLSHLRESGAIEQDADVVCLLSRKQEQDGGGQKADPDPHTPIDADLMVAKNRNGRTGLVKLSFVPAYTHFEDRHEGRVDDEAVPEDRE
ncbi:MAG: Replicative DNA helicase [Lentisphaerae bacterium ADurb.BinA184]|nr:MAG: Replicative DNA helicase [Lentisphaerae bacterium ADurb.BinA184]